MFKRLCMAVLVTAALAAAPAPAQVITLADTLIGGVGGVAVDRLGNVYSADFMDTVRRIRPDGRVEKFADGLYGPSGNVVDRQGYLLQANFFGNYIVRIDRRGQAEMRVAEGLNGPVGLAFGPDGALYVNNCAGNAVSRVGPDRVARPFAGSDLFNCPNGFTVGPDGSLYVVNFRDGNMLRVSREGAVSLFATIPGGGNGHVAVARGAFYVTAFQTNRIYRVTTDGTVTLVAGTGAFGEVDGPAEEAAFTFPNGIAVGPAGDRLYVNDYVNRTPPNVLRLPVPVASLRLLKLAAVSDVMAAGLSYAVRISRRLQDERLRGCLVSQSVGEHETFSRPKYADLEVRTGSTGRHTRAQPD
ncbi:virginiamycin B lyase family protein [Rhodocaloribacter sp.]